MSTASVRDHSSVNVLPVANTVINCDQLGAEHRVIRRRSKGLNQSRTNKMDNLCHPCVRNTVSPISLEGLQIQSLPQTRLGSDQPGSILFVRRNTPLKMRATARTKVDLDSCFREV